MERSNGPDRAKDHPMRNLPVRACSIICTQNPEWGTWGVMEDRGSYYEIHGASGSRVLDKGEAERFWSLAPSTPKGLDESLEDAPVARRELTVALPPPAPVVDSGINAEVFAALKVLESHIRRTVDQKFTEQDMQDAETQERARIITILVDKCGSEELELQLLLVPR